MRFFFSFFVVFLASLHVGAQDFQLSFTLAHSTFVRGEPAVAQLELLNVGRDLVNTGTAPGQDKFVVEVSYGEKYNTLKPLTAAPFAKAFELKPGSKHLSRIELDKWFNLLKEGKYFVSLVFIHKGIRYKSEEKAFDVVPGIPVKEGVQMFVREQKLRRVFKLVHWSRNRNERLFLRIEDEPSGVTWDTIDLGPHLKSNDPKLDIASNGEVTIVHRATQDSFNRIVIWSLPGSLEIAEHDQLLDPEVSASQRVRSLYGDMIDDGPVNPETKRSWWKFW